MIENTCPQRKLLAPGDVLLTQLCALLLEHKQLLCTAESCTGGLIAACCTEKPGSSQWFERGFVTYSNHAKHESLGVPLVLIEQYGAVSQEVAHAMALGALAHSKAHWSVAVTGVAGPTGGSAAKPIGLVWFGFAQRPSLQLQDQQLFTAHTESRLFPGNRHTIRQAAVEHALKVLIEQIPQMPCVL